MTNLTLAVIVGSTRRDSINRKLAQAIAKLATGRFGVSFIRIDDLPMYDQDLEADMPAAVTRFKDKVAKADALLFVTPEHNRSIPAVLKNAVDWGGRPYGQNSWSDKLVMVTGTSPGPIGTALAQQHLRVVLSILGALVLGGEAYITFKPGLIDEAANITDDSTQKFLQGFVDRLATLTAQTTPAKQRSAA
jgi:chromate reductase, NAD(P)H dehydrogenase (quinone)